MNWQAIAPANIALIKYMGKSSLQNHANNASLSYTSERFSTTVTLTLIEKEKDSWHANQSVALSVKQQQRFLDHLHRLKQYAHCPHSFGITSVNNFPAQCGLASSASSFAALTQCALKAFSTLCADWSEPSLQQAAALSRIGSGSSCRSFLTPWALWDNQGVHQFNTLYPTLQHRVIVVNQRAKAVSSSEAHQRVTTSLLYAGRTDRANHRLKLMQTALAKGDWSLAYHTAWQEFWDMHALFETADKPFSYMTGKTLDVLAQIRKVWHDQHDGPLVTLDAGPNVHLLFRLDQAALQQAFLKPLEQQYLIL